MPKTNDPNRFRPVERLDERRPPEPMTSKLIEGLKALAVLFILCLVAILGAAGVVHVAQWAF